jgi:IS5 family transposase
MEEALYEIASLRSFAHLSLNEAIPDETTILNFRWSCPRTPGHGLFAI